MIDCIEVKRLPKQPGAAAWNAILPAQGEPRVLESDDVADIAIIGGGFTGLSAARRLLQLDPGLKIALLEAGRVAEGPAGRNSGFMIDLPHDLASEDYAGHGMDADRRQTEQNRFAISFAGSAIGEYGIPSEAYAPVGKTNAAASERGESFNRTYGEHLARMGERFEMLDGKTMREMTGGSYYSSGLFTPGAVILQPALYIRGLAKGVSRMIALYENSPVVKMERRQDNWKLMTPKGSIHADKVILATNGHVESFGFFSRRLMHVFTYASMTRRLSDGEVYALGGAPSWGVTPADPMGATVRRVSGTGGNRIVVRFRFTYDPSMEVSDARLAKVSRLHEQSFLRRFAMLKDVPMEYRWAGHLCLSRNGVPAFGEVAQNIYAACCQNGLGTARGTLSGIAVAELILGEQSELAKSLLAQDAPARLPPEPIAWIGANTYLRYRERRAGVEC